MTKKMLVRFPRTVEDKDSGRKIILNKMERFYVDDESGFHGNKFVVDKETLKESGVKEIVKDRLAVFDATFSDNYKRIKRLAQIITLKDIGAIIAHTGMNKNSVVIEAGSGSGGFSCFIANFVKRVDSFDINVEHQSMAKENAKRLGFKNINFEIGDVYDENSIESKYDNKYDVFLLDVPEPSKALGSARRVLNTGGFLVVYAPHIFQVQDVVKALPENLIVEKTIEVIERDWNVSEKTLRPATKDFGHTAFLCFIRKVY